MAPSLAPTLGISIFCIRVSHDQSLLNFLLIPYSSRLSLALMYVCIPACESHSHYTNPQCHSAQADAHTTLCTEHTCFYFYHAYTFFSHFCLYSVMHTPLCYALTCIYFCDAHTFFCLLSLCSVMRTPQLLVTFL